eukprot:scaffold63905_cov46-Attheya_sp.AAC.4
MQKSTFRPVIIAVFLNRRVTRSVTEAGQEEEGQSTIIISFISAFRSSGSWCLLSAAAKSSTRHRLVACLKGGYTGIALLGLHIHHPLGTSLQMESDNASDSAWRSTRRTKPTAANENKENTTTKGASKKEPTAKNTKKRKPPVAKPSTGKNSKPTQKQPKPTNKQTKRPEPQRLTERDELPKLWNAQEALENTGSYSLRAVMENHPEALSDLATK